MHMKQVNMADIAHDSFDVQKPVLRELPPMN